MEFQLSAGDPRQIIPVAGRPLFDINKYFTLPCDSTDLKEKDTLVCRQSYVASRNEWFQSLFKIYISCTTNAVHSLKNTDYAALSFSASTYTLTTQQINPFNQFYKRKELLYTTPWLDAIWLLPTWQLVNEHLMTLSRHMAKTRLSLDSGVRYRLPITFHLKDENVLRDCLVPPRQ